MRIKDNSFKNINEVESLVETHDKTNGRSKQGLNVSQNNGIFQGENQMLSESEANSFGSCNQLRDVRHINC